MKGFRISEALELPLNAVTERIGFIGQSGSGKTFAAGRLAELMMDAGAQVVVLDPVGAWWGLRAASDGKRAGYPIHVMGGLHADLPLTPSSGRLVAELLADRGISAVLDVSDFTLSEMTQFACDYAEAFYAAKRKHKGPVHLFIEEAHNFLPQNLPPEGKGGDPRKSPAVMLNRWERLIRQGRNLGIGCSLITQMPQAVNKKGLNQISCLFAMRTLGPHERKAIGGWMNDMATSKSQLGLEDLLPGLATGESFVASPFWLKTLQKVRISMKTTFDSSKTPEFGVELQAPKVLAEVDVAALREAMKTIVDEAEAGDTKALQRRIRELEAQVRKGAAAPVQVAAAPVEVPVVKPEDVERIEAVAQKFEEVFRELDSMRGMILSGITNLRGAIASAAIAGKTRRPYEPPKLTTVAAPPRHRIESAPAASGTADELGAGERRMLEALAMRHPAAMTRKDLGVACAYAATGGTFRTYLPALHKRGLVEYRGELVAISPAGLGAVGNQIRSAPTTTDDLIALWSGTLGKGERKMLDVLVQYHPESMTRAALGGASGYEAAGGTFRTYLPRLHKLGLVEYVGDEVRASDTLFITGKAA